MHESEDTVAKLRPPLMKGATYRRSDDAVRGGVAVDALPGISGTLPAIDRAQEEGLDFVVIADPYPAAALGWIVERRVDRQVATHRQPASHPS